MKTYIYGIIDSNEDIDEATIGLNGTHIYNIPYRDIGIVVSDLNKHSKDPVNSHTSVHNNIVEKVMQRFTIIPVRFHTYFNRENVFSMMKSHYNDFRENLDRLRNKAVFNIRVIWKGDEIREQITREYTRKNYRKFIARSSHGERFIEDGFEKYTIEQELLEKADICASIIDNFLNRFASDNRIEKLKINDLFLNAFYLVEKRRQKDFIGAFNVLKIAPGDFRSLCSGPMPPYNFINLEYSAGLGDPYQTRKEAV